MAQKNRMFGANKFCFFALLLLALGTSNCNYRKNKTEGTPNGTFADPSGLFASSEINLRVFGPRCSGCHGDAGGVNLETYESVMANIGPIMAAVQSGRMPPRRALGTGDLELLQKWISEGSPLHPPPIEDGEEPPTESPTEPPPAPVEPPSTPVEPPPAPDVPAPTPVPSEPQTPTPTPTPTPAQPIVFSEVFQKVIEPRCVRCHGSDSEHSLERYDEVVFDLPGLRNAVETDRMPPKRPLTPEQKTLLLNWIDQGAHK